MVEEIQACVSLATRLVANIPAPEAPLAPYLVGSAALEAEARSNKTEPFCLLTSTSLPTIAVSILTRDISKALPTSATRQLCPPSSCRYHSSVGTSSTKLRLPVKARPCWVKTLATAPRMACALTSSRLPSASKSVSLIACASNAGSRLARLPITISLDMACTKTEP